LISNRVKPAILDFLNKFCSYYEITYYVNIICTTCTLFNLRERDYWGDRGVDGRIILRKIFRKWDVGGMDWIELLRDRHKW
jgi:hypothetical protein